MTQWHIIKSKAKWISLAILITAIISFAAIFILHTRAPKEIVPTAKLGMAMIKDFPFSKEDALKEWEEKIFKNKVIYTIEKNGSLSYVKAKSDNAASALYYKIKLDAKTKHPVVRWQWKAGKFPVKKFPESLDKEKEDDFAARVYVIFPALFITNSKVLEYVWAETLPVGSTGTSPYSPNIKLIVLKSGSDKDNKWIAEERDVVADYLKMFGRPPEYNVGAVAFMTNTEHTGASAEASYDEIELGYKEETAKNKGGAN